MAERPTAPVIALDTSNLSESSPGEASSRQNMLTPPEAGVDSNNLLMPTTPTSQYDGATLHSRSGSIVSGKVSNRSRANSANTYVTQSDLQRPDPNIALLPDKGNESDFQVDQNPFAFSPGQLNKMLNPKSLPAFWVLGGLRGLEKGLRTSVAAGLSIDETSLTGQVTFDDAVAAGDKDAVTSVAIPDNDVQVTNREIKGQFADRLRVYTDNRLPEKKAPSIFTLIWTTYKDPILILLTVAAVISLALGLYETFSEGHGVEWVEGVAIVIAIVIVVTVGAANDWQKERQFVKLNRRKDDREVKVIRSGKSVQISVHDITVGDVLHLEPGDAVPADGVFISGHGVKCDESSATGESDQMKKTGGDEVYRQLISGTADKKLDPFIISGSKVLEGVGTYLVTSVGVNSSFGKIMMSMRTENEDTPLQVKLGRLAKWIGALGASAAILMLIILTIKFGAALPSNTGSPAMKGQQWLDILIVAITIIVVAVPEGLPLAVTLALAFATTRMLKENNLVRVLKACETMGNATTICSDKTGTLTQNKMTVVAGTIGIDEKFASSDSGEGKSVSTFANVFSKLSRSVRELLRTSISLNSTAFEGEEKGVPTFIGSKTETALLTMAKEHLGLDGLAAERANAEIVQLFPFDSARKCMGAVVKTPTGYRLLVKGAAEIMLKKAVYTISDVLSEDLQTRNITSEDRENALDTIDGYAQHSLRTIGMLYKEFSAWPPEKSKRLEEDNNMADFESVFREMVWAGVVGIHDPLRPGVIEAVSQCAMSGVVVRMVTGDNITTARAIAIDCGILKAGDDMVVMEGPEFRQLPDQEMDRILPRLRVLARSSPEDKRILVARLKHLGETVAVTGDGTNDGPALKTADVGFSMGIAGTEVAKEASSIILLDDNFSSTITALMWGRAVNDAVKKFLQFQITVNITAVVLAFVSAISSTQNESVLTAVQLLWVNLIMDTLAALALATDPPTHKILQRPPQPKSAPLITINMWKMIFGQAVYQLVVTFVLFFAGARILNYTPEQDLELRTVVFNTFVWMQIFNAFNNRRLDNKFNVLEGVHRNFWFQGIALIMIGGQVMIIFVGGAAFGITRLNGPQWAISILCALPCLLWGVIIRLFPDSWFEVIFNGCYKGVSFIVVPAARCLKFVFRPVTATFRAVGRVTKRVFKKKDADQESDENKVDEETGNAFDRVNTNSSIDRNEKQIVPHINEPPLTPMSESGKPQQDVPSFSITAPN